MSSLKTVTVLGVFILWIRPSSCCGPLGGVGQPRDIVNLNLECDDDYDGTVSESRNQEVTLLSSDCSSDHVAEEMIAFEEKTCDLCNCLTKSLPTSVKNGQFIFTNRKKDDSRSILVGSRSDMSVSADSFRPAYAMPPDNFRPTAAENPKVNVVAKMNRGLKKIVSLVNVFGNVNKYFSDRTEGFLSRVVRLLDDQ